MRHITLLAASAALALALSHPASAYTGAMEGGSALDVNGASMSVMMQIDSAPSDKPAMSAAAQRETDALHSADASPSAPRKDGDQFQRYFDSHYRAHLVLDAAAHRNTTVE